MIDFRYHLVSIVAVFLALAIGIVLGSTELQGPTYNLLNQTTAKLQNELDQTSNQRDAAQQQANLGENYAQAVQPVVLHNLLQGQRLLIVTEPGAPASVVNAISKAATQNAGATVTGQISLQPKFFDNSDTTLAGLNQTNLSMAQADNIVLRTGATYQQQAVQVIASEVLTQASGTTGSPSATNGGQDTNAQTMLSAYASQGFLSTSGQPSARASLALLVTAQSAPARGSSDPLDQVLVPVATELAASSAAAVVAGVSANSGAGSAIAVIRGSSASGKVSTVDDADLVIGQTAAIQAMALQLQGGNPGSYGLAGGASAAAPNPAPTAGAGSSPNASASSAAKKDNKNK